MAIKFEKIQPGMTLWSRGRVRMGRTTMSRMGEWPVYVKDVWPEARTALVSWNGNTPEVWGEGRLTRLYAKRMTRKDNP
jgi:hypothetical protein